jgi:hypothetical protein
VASPDNHRANKGDATSGAQAGAVDQDSAGTLNPVDANPEAQNPNDHGSDEQPRSYENIIARWTVILGISTVVLAIATILSAYFLFVTDHTLKDTLIETRKSANAAHDAVRVAQSTAEMQLRAYLSAEASELLTLEGGSLGAIISIKFKNAGTTPAYNVRSTMGAGFRKDPLPPGIDMSWFKTVEFNADVIFPHNDRVAFAVNSPPDGRPQKLTRADTIYVCADTKYFDVFKKERTTKFCAAASGGDLPDAFFKGRPRGGMTNITWAYDRYEAD